MHIALDATCWANRRGFGRHARALLRAIARNDQTTDYTAICDHPQIAAELPDRFEIRRVATRRPTATAASARGRRSLADLYLLNRAFSDPSFDVLLFPTIYSYVPVWSSAKKLVMIHDVTAETYPQLTLANRRARLLWSAKIAAGCRQADGIIAVSEFSRRGIIAKLAVEPDRVFVAGEAPDEVFRVLETARPSDHLRQLGIDDSVPLVVFVGGFSPHKNIGLLVDAFHQLGETSSAQLVLVGELDTEVFHSCLAAVREQVRRQGLDHRVLFTGYLPDDELALLLNLATVLVLPSMMEGFGLPAVEAAACGCPVIATRESPLPEILGDAGLYVRPGDGAALRDALDEVLSSRQRRRTMSEAGRKAAALLSWDDAAKRVRSIAEEVAGR